MGTAAIYAKLRFFRRAYARNGAIRTKSEKYLNFSLYGIHIERLLAVGNTVFIKIYVSNSYVFCFFDNGLLNRKIMPFSKAFVYKWFTVCEYI